MYQDWHFVEHHCHCYDCWAFSDPWTWAVSNCLTSFPNAWSLTGFRSSSLQSFFSLEMPRRLQDVDCKIGWPFPSYSGSLALWFAICQAFCGWRAFRRWSCYLWCSRPSCWARRSLNHGLHLIGCWRGLLAILDPRLLLAAGWRLYRLPSNSSLAFLSCSAPLRRTRWAARGAGSAIDWNARNRWDESFAD